MKKQYIFWDIEGESCNIQFYKDLKDAYNNGNYTSILSSVQGLLEHLLKDKLIKMSVALNPKTTYCELIRKARKTRIITFNTAEKLTRYRLIRNDTIHPGPKPNLEEVSYQSIMAFSKCLEELFKTNCHTFIYLPYIENARFS